MQGGRWFPPAGSRSRLKPLLPQRAIDHILIGDGLSCSGTCAMPAARSDHLAISLELEVPESALR